MNSKWCALFVPGLLLLRPPHAASHNRTRSNSGTTRSMEKLRRKLKRRRDAWIISFVALESFPDSPESVTESFCQFIQRRSTPCVAFRPIPDTVPGRPEKCLISFRNHSQIPILRR